MATKAELLKILEKPHGNIIAIDMDGTLCHGEFWDDAGKPVVNEPMKELVRKLYKKGAHIIIYTARQPRYYAFTHGWLVSNEIPFHGICMTMKPGAEVYIDDKALNIEDVL